MERKNVIVPKSEIEAQKEYSKKIREYYSSKGKTPLALVETYGCQQNENDSERIKGMLFEMGFSFTDDEEKADFIAENLGKRINQIVVEQREKDGE